MLCFKRNGNPSIIQSLWWKIRPKKNVASAPSYAVNVQPEFVKGQAENIDGQHVMYSNDDANSIETLTNDRIREEHAIGRAI